MTSYPFDFKNSETAIFSAYMTRGHNNSRMITMGAQLVGDELAKNIAKGFVNGKYDGGRHQIRVDMLNKMG
ncbi:galactose-6-phosphate isomerase subunit LacA [Streptococcus pneumoniae]|nr:galactose-6-phosphate isomerase subunit LacA [Streptococcus pneumoniae]